MYDYNFNNEKVIKEAVNVNLKFQERYFLANILLTNKNLLIFIDANQDSPLKGSAVNVTPEYVLFAKFDLNNLDYTKDKEEIIINKNLILYNFDLKSFLK